MIKKKREKHRRRNIEIYVERLTLNNNSTTEMRKKKIPKKLIAYILSRLNFFLSFVRLWDIHITYNKRYRSFHIKCRLFPLLFLFYLFIYSFLYQFVCAQCICELWHPFLVFPFHLIHCLMSSNTKEFAIIMIFILSAIKFGVAKEYKNENEKP